METTIVYWGYIGIGLGFRVLGSGFRVRGEEVPRIKMGIFSEGRQTLNADYLGVIVCNPGEPSKRKEHV